jgi:hypothetical protein
MSDVSIEAMVGLPVDLTVGVLGFWGVDLLEAEAEAEAVYEPEGSPSHCDAISRLLRSVIEV